MITVLCATKGDRHPAGLCYIPDEPADRGYLRDQSKPWAAAANALLDQCETDALFLDDDIELTPHTFQCFDRYRERADIIGFTLFRPTLQGLALQSAGFQFLKVADGEGAMLFPVSDLFSLFQPRYVAHVTASCMFVSQKVIASGLRFPVWPGQHHEDAAFTYEAWIRGFKVMHVPGPVIHHMGGTGAVGATKSQDPTFQADMAVNWAALQKWQQDNDIAGKVNAGIIPLGTKEVQ